VKFLLYNQKGFYENRERIFVELRLSNTVQI